MRRILFLLVYKWFSRSNFPFKVAFFRRDKTNLRGWSISNEQIDIKLSIFERHPKDAVGIREEKRLT